MRTNAIRMILALASVGIIAASISAGGHCNRASTTWRANTKGELQFGSWSRTSASCGPGSLHDRIVNDGAAVRNFAIKDGHLFLSGMEGGGHYELEPAPRR